MVAAGSGSRLGASVPKALVELHGTTLVRRSIDALADAGVHKAVVTIPAGLQQTFDDVLSGSPIPVRCVLGGDRRQDSVRRALTLLREEDAATIVLVHDAARPLVPPAVVHRVVAAVAGGADAVVPTVPLIDSVRRVFPGGSAVVDRSHLRAVQTPQGFRLSVLTAAHAHVEDDALDVTDDAAACETMGVGVVLVEGHRHGFKITEPVDMLLAESVLATGGAR